MKYTKYKRKIIKSGIAVLLLLCLVLTGCNSGTDNNSGSAADDSGSTAAADFTADNSAKSSAEAVNAQYKDEDTDASYEEADAERITLNGSSASSDSDHVKITDSTVTITAAGDYLLQGSYTGSILVTADDSDDVRLILDGVTVTADKNAAIYCTAADKLIITLAERTTNTLKDAAGFSYTDETNEEPDAALFSKADLSLNGTGTLIIDASYKNGIGTKDDLVMTGGSYQITASGDALRGRDSVTIIDGTYDLSAGSDSIQSNNDEDDSKGWISVEGGILNITAGNDGIQAQTTLAVTGGTLDISSGGGSKASAADTSQSCKGLKAGGDLYLAGGVFTVNSADDAVHSNADIQLDGGTYELASGDDGVHADGDLIAAPDKLTISTCYEGLEAKSMTISDGDINIYAADDGINISGGTDSTDAAAGTAGSEDKDGGGAQGRFGADQFASGSASSDQWLSITGGTINITSEADSIDINGSARISGGTVTLNGPENGIETSIDYDQGSFIITGGEVRAASGYSNMFQSFGDDSTQTVLNIIYSSAQSKDTAVTVTDSSGNTIIKAAPERSFQTLILSSEKLEQGETYTVTTGSKSFDITPEDMITTVNDSGEETAVSGGRGGGANRGSEKPSGRGGTGGTPPNDAGEPDDTGGGNP